MTSLWRVDDEATGELMAMYYQKLLDKQKPGDRLAPWMPSMQTPHPARSQPSVLLGPVPGRRCRRPAPLSQTLAKLMTQRPSKA